VREDEVIAMWRCYELKYEAKSALHIGYGSQLGMVTRTRYYIPGKTLWGAVTAVLSREIMESYDAEIYKNISDFVKNHLIFSYFYPVKGADVLYPNYTDEGFGFGSKENGKFVMSKEEFEKEFISSYVSTALDKTSRAAEEGSLHEFELISPCEFVGYLFTNLEKNQGSTRYGMPIFIREVSEEEINVEIKGNEVEVFEAIKEIQVGGERIYGFGRLELRDKPRREVNKIFAKYELNLNANGPRMNSVIALSHVMVKGDEGDYFDKLRDIRGDIEPLVWREWNEKGAGQYPKFGGIALVPGSRFDSNDMEIGPYGILKPV
jgi:hypothetical protein